MSEETQDQAAEQETQDPSYIIVTTGSSKHPDAAHSEDGRVEANTSLFVGNTEDPAQGLEEAIEKYGHKFVHDQFIRSVTVSTQGKVRRELDNGVPVTKVEEIYDDCDPTETRSSTKDPVSSAMSAFSKMSDEEKAQFIASLEG